MCIGLLGNKVISCKIQRGPLQIQCGYFADSSEVNPDDADVAQLYKMTVGLLVYRKPILSAS